MLKYSATSPAEWTKHCADSAWLLLSECFPAMFCSQVSRRSGEFWYPLAILVFKNPGESYQCTFTYSHFLKTAEYPVKLYLYIKSTSISGSSWCSFILTVSDRIIWRLNTRSWTWNGREWNKYSAQNKYLLVTSNLCDRNSNAKIACHCLFF